MIELVACGRYQTSANRYRILATSHDRLLTGQGAGAEGDQDGTRMEQWGGVMHQNMAVHGTLWPSCWAESGFPGWGMVLATKRSSNVCSTRSEESVEPGMPVPDSPAAMENRSPFPLSSGSLAAPVRPWVFHGFQAGDADEHARNLSQWNQTYDQLTPGAFQGRISELWLRHAQVFVETTNRSLRQSCSAWPRSLWFGIPAPQGRPAAVEGREMGFAAIALQRGGADFELRTPDDFSIYGIVVDEEEFVRYVEEVEHLSPEQLLGPLGGEGVLTVDRSAKERLCQGLGSLLGQAGGRGKAGDSLSGWHSEGLQDRILGGLVEVLLTGAEYPGSSGRASLTTAAHRQQVVAQVREYLLAHAAEGITVPDLCRRFHMSRRTLQYCFEAVTGLPPMAYLRLLRLNGARRELKLGEGAPKERGTVSDVALAWGFTHFSQFAQDYRQLFGELPSETLKHRQGVRVPRLGRN